MKKSKILSLMVFMAAFVTAISSVFAVTSSVIDTSKTGSLTITALAQNNGSTDTTPLEGVEYTLYKVDVIDGTTVTTVAEAESAISSLTAVDSQTTNSSGVVSFTRLALGRYYAKVTSVPTGTSEVPESFLVDIPMTNSTGDGWIYDIEVSPKVQTATGTAVLTKTDLAGEPMVGVTFKVQISTEDGVWEDYTPEGTTEVLTLTTDASGQVTLEDLPITYNGLAATYRLVETSTTEGYIIDNAYLDTIKVNSDGTVTVTDGRSGNETTSNTGELTLVNEKPEVSKKVDGNNDVVSASLTDTISFTVVADVPTMIADLTTYTITDTLPAGLTGRTNITVTGYTVSGEETIPTSAYTKEENGKVLTVTFDPDELTDYTNVKIAYDVVLDMDNAIIGEDGNVNTAVLTYTNEVSTDGTEATTTTTEDTAKVVTGGIKIFKEDTSGTALSGAVFKIATSEANALAGTFVKDENGNDIEVTSGTDGYATIDGLAYNDDETALTYYLVETQAPTYVEDGETKSYTLLSSPVEVTVDGTSHEYTIEVVNKKPYTLPLTGGIGAIVFILVGMGLIVIAKKVKEDKVTE